MTFKERINFYDADQEKYVLITNDDFIKRVSTVNDVKKEHNCYLFSVDVMKYQALIDYLCEWYFIKYPERELEYLDGIHSTDIKVSESISKYMSVEQFLYRLPKDMLNLITVPYEDISFVIKNINEEGIPYLSATICCIRRDSKFKVLFDPFTGKVLPESIPGITGIKDKEDLDIEELYRILTSGDNEFKYGVADLNKHIVSRTLSKDLRNEVLKLAAVKMLYDRRTTPERGFERAERFISEFNEKVCNGKLDMDYANEIMSKDYNLTEKGVVVLNKKNN